MNITGGETFVKKTPAVKIMDLARVISEQAGVPFKPVIIGMLPGEKIHEILITEEELPRAADLGDYCMVHPTWVKYQGTRIERAYDSSSHLVKSDEDIVELLAKSDAEFDEFGIRGVFLK